MSQRTNRLITMREERKQKGPRLQRKVELLMDRTRSESLADVIGRAAQTEVDEALLARQTDHRHGYNDRGLAPAHREIVLTVPEALDLIADMERAMLGVPIPLREFRTAEQQLAVENFTSAWCEARDVLIAHGREVERG
jgi:hypothetical protein